MSDKLFEIEPITPGLTCWLCVNRQRWHCGSKVIQYCGARKSNRTTNGLLKIKARGPACELYKIYIE